MPSPGTHGRLEGPTGRSLAYEYDGSCCSIRFGRSGICRNGKLIANSFSNETRLVSFVESAVAYAHVNAKDMALNEFSNKTGLFVRGDLYIYAF
jgi:hypothetical protein